MELHENLRRSPPVRGLEYSHRPLPLIPFAMIAGLAELKRHGFKVVANQDSQSGRVLCRGRRWSGPTVFLGP